MIINENNLLAIDTYTKKINNDANNIANINKENFKRVDTRIIENNLNSPIAVDINTNEQSDIMKDIVDYINLGNGIKINTIAIQTQDETNNILIKELGKQ